MFTARTALVANTAQASNAHVRKNLIPASMPAVYHHSPAAANLERQILFIMVRRSHRQTGIGFYRRQRRE
jgi:hypothetical protein